MKGSARRAKSLKIWMTPDEFKAIREELGMTQQDLAEKLKISLSTVQNAENRRTRIQGITNSAMHMLRELRDLQHEHGEQ